MHYRCSQDVDVEAVFLHPDEPPLEFEGFLKKQYPRIRYFQVISRNLESGTSKSETVSKDPVFPGNKQ